MRILVDIGHPGHVHYFKNTIRIMKKEGVKILVVARKREFIFDLLKSYDIDYVSRGEGSNSFFGKFVYMFRANHFIWKIAKDFKPDLFLSFSSPYAAQVSRFMKRPHIAVNDTEHEDTMYSIFTYPFSSVILTPQSFLSSLGKKQIRFKNLVEGFYLHKNYYKPRTDVYKQLGIDSKDEYVLFRFVSWKAHHDFGQSGMSFQMKMELVERLRKKFKIFISSEQTLPPELEQYKLPTRPDQIHDVIYNATLFIGESSTMASESALLGTNAVFINSLPLMCNIKTGQDHGLIKQFKSNKGVLEYVDGLVKNRELKQTARKMAIEMQKDFIDPTQFLVWFLKNYPDSKKTMLNRPEYQDRFK